MTQKSEYGYAHAKQFYKVLIEHMPLIFLYKEPKGLNYEILKAYKGVITREMIKDFKRRVPLLRFQIFKYKDKRGLFIEPIAMFIFFMLFTGKIDILKQYWPIEEEKLMPFLEIAGVSL